MVLRRRRSEKGYTQRSPNRQWIGYRTDENSAGRVSCTLLASIGVPLLLNALTGKGLQADSTGSANTMSVYVPDTTNGHGIINQYPYMSPPFFETWNNPVGAGVKKKKKGKGITARQKQPIQFNSSSRNNTIRLIKKTIVKYGLIALGQTTGNKI